MALNRLIVSLPMPQVMPVDYKRVLEAQVKEEEAA